MSEALPPDSEIANYRIQRVLGRGGMGVVYLAEHVHLQRMAALKTISGAYAQNPQFRDRFVRESRMAAQIDHAHIVPIYDAGEAQGLLYLAMRFVDGEDLDGLIARQAPMADLAGLLEVFDQVASALDAAHAAGLVHRDVKPANILLEPRGPGGAWHAYLADFGLTKHAGSDSGLTVTGQVIGTPFYVAPEQADGRDLDGRADQYSLGCVLFECLTGRRPFDADGQLLAILAAHATAARPQVTDHRPDLPPAIDAVVARSVAVDPHERFATCAEFVAACRAALPADADAGQPAADGPPEASPAQPAGHPAGIAAPEAPALDDDTEPPATDDDDAEPQPAVAPAGDRAQPARDTAAGVKPPPPGPPGQAGRRAARGDRRQRTAAVVLGVVVLATVAAAALASWLPTEDGDPRGESAEPAAAGADDDTGGSGGSDGTAPQAPPPPSQRILFASDRDGDTEVYAVAPDGSNLENLTHSPDSEDRQARWAPDRERIVFASDRSGEFVIYTMDADGGDVARVTSAEGGADLDPVFSPDGERIAFSDQRGGTRSIYVIGVDGSGLQRLTGDGGPDMRPTWSPQGDKLAFHRVAGDEQIDLLVQSAVPEASPVNVTGAEDRTAHDGADEPERTGQDGDSSALREWADRLGEGAERAAASLEDAVSQLDVRSARNFHPSWSPRGDRLVFASDRSGSDDVYTLDVTGVLDGEAPGGARRVTRNATADDLDPSWGPGGEWIAFESKRDGQSEIYLIRADGSGLRRVTDSPGTDADPGW